MKEEDSAQWLIGLRPWGHLLDSECSGAYKILTGFRLLPFYKIMRI